MMTTQTVIAVSATEFEEAGCPHCGYRSGYSPIWTGGAVAWTCGECGETCCVLADGINKSPIGFGEIYPELQPHPRRGTPSHGNLDKRPEGGGEFFAPRGIGYDRTPGCFVCGGSEGVHHNIAAFVQTKTAGERVIRMFPQGARLDYRPHEPDRVQVKIGACEAHLQNLHQLIALARGGVITPHDVREARGLK